MRHPAGTEATSPGDAAGTEVAGPQGRLVVPACPFGGVPALVPVVMVQKVAHDDATVSHLLSQTLLAEQEAKEVEELEAKLADREQQLLMACRELRGRFDLRDQVTLLETQVIGLAGIKREIRQEEGEEKEGDAQKTVRSSTSLSCCRGSSPWSSLFGRP